MRILKVQVFDFQGFSSASTSDTVDSHVFHSDSKSFGLLMILSMLYHHIWLASSLSI